MIAVSLVLTTMRFPGTDVSIALYLAESSLAGGVIGRDFFEVNPPLFLWLTYPVSWIQEPLVRWRAYVVLVASAAIVSSWCSALLTSGWRPLGDTARWTRVFLVAIALLVLPAPEFGQREHWAAVMLLPYVALLCATVDIPHTRWRWLIGAAGGVAISLKPFFLLPLIALFGVDYARASHNAFSRPEFKALLLTGVLYVLCVFLFFPDYIRFGMEHAALYARYLRQPLLTTLLASSDIAVLLVAVLVWLFARPSVPSGRTSFVFLITAIGFWAAAVVQQKALPYHYYPAVAFSWLSLCSLPDVSRRELGTGLLNSIARGAATGLLLGALISIVIRSALAGQWIVVASLACGFIAAAMYMLRPSRARSRATTVASFAKVFAGSFALGVLWLSATPLLSAKSSATDPDLPLLLPLARKAGHQGVAVFSSNPASTWPLVYLADATWSLRYVSLWPLPALYPPHPSGDSTVIRAPHGTRWPNEEARFVERVVFDFVRHKPALLLVMNPDLSAQNFWGGATRFDYLSYFAADTGFSRTLAAYTEVPSIGRYRVFWNEEFMSTESPSQSASIAHP